MCIFKEIGKFVKNGASVFNEASKGSYSRQSEAIRSIEKSYFQKMMVRSLMTSVILPRTGRM